MKIRPTSTFGLGSTAPANSTFSKNHFASKDITPELTQKIASMGLNRVAGNIYESPSTRDFWKVQGGKVIKLVGSEVDNGESIPAADEQNPAFSLKGFLDDLEF